jgi:flagellar biogenesis protein FliO
MIFLIGLLTGMLIFTLFLIWYLKRENNNENKYRKSKK